VDWSEVAVVVPARLESSRLPHKLLQPVAGHPVLSWTLHALKQLPLPPDHLAVATGDPAIQDLAERSGVRVVSTPQELPSGTHRVAVASAHLPPAVRWVMNVQGDEPLIDPATVEAVWSARGPSSDLLTAACPITAEEWLDPHTVKAIVDARGKALWFTRAPEPFRLRELPRAALESALAQLPQIHRHLGIYGFRRDRLEQWLDLPDCPLAHTAALEQLAALSAGWTIQVAKVPRPRGPSVDTAADLDAVRAILSTCPSESGPGSPSSTALVSP